MSQRPCRSSAAAAGDPTGDAVVGAAANGRPTRVRAMSDRAKEAAAAADEKRKRSQKRKEKEAGYKKAKITAPNKVEVTPPATTRAAAITQTAKKNQSVAASDENDERSDSSETTLGLQKSEKEKKKPAKTNKRNNNSLLRHDSDSSFTLDSPSPKNKKKTKPLTLAQDSQSTTGSNDEQEDKDEEDEEERDKRMQQLWSDVWKACQDENIHINVQLNLHDKSSDPQFKSKNIILTNKERSENNRNYPKAFQLPFSILEQDFNGKVVPAINQFIEDNCDYTLHDYGSGYKLYHRGSPVGAQYFSTFDPEEMTCKEPKAMSTQDDWTDALRDSLDIDYSEFNKPDPAVGHIGHCMLLLSC